MNIELQFTWTFDEYRQLQFTHAKALNSIPRQHSIPLIASPTFERRFTLTSIAILTFIAYGTLELWLGNSLQTFFCGFPLLIPFAWIYMNPAGSIRLKAAWLNNPDFQLPVTYTLSDDHFIRIAPGIQSTMQWSAITHAFENKAFFLLFRGTQLALTLPKRAFQSPDDIQTFHNLCRQISQSKTHAFPVEKAHPSQFTSAG